MSSHDVLDMFYNHIYHQNVFRSDFGKNDFLVDFQIFYLWVTGEKPQKTAKNRDKPLKTTKTVFLLCGPFPQKRRIDNSS